MNATQHAECYNEVQADITRLESELVELRAVAKWHISKANGNVPASNDHADDLELEPRQKTRISGPYTHMKQIVACEEVLRATGEPMPTKVIAEKMIEGGFMAKNLKKLIGSVFTGMTRRPDTFEKAGPGMWKLKEAQE
jgi:hypothetical protein